AESARLLSRRAFSKHHHYHSDHTVTYDASHARKCRFRDSECITVWYNFLPRLKNLKFSGLVSLPRKNPYIQFLFPTWLNLTIRRDETWQTYKVYSSISIHREFLAGSGHINQNTLL